MVTEVKNGTIVITIDNEDIKDAARFSQFFMTTEEVEGILEPISIRLNRFVHKVLEQAIRNEYPNL